MAEIELKNVSKRFPDGAVGVDDANLHIKDGEFIILVGPSGCGKSTTLNMIAGLEDITDGDLLIGGDRVNDVAFDLDTDFGDEDAEMQIATDVSPEGYEPHVLFAGDTARPVVLWAPRGADLSALDVVLEERA